jgi:hypothetical protein
MLSGMSEQNMKLPIRLVCLWASLSTACDPGTLQTDYRSAVNDQRENRQLDDRPGEREMDPERPTTPEINETPDTITHGEPEPPDIHPIVPPPEAPEPEPEPMPTPHEIPDGAPGGELDPFAVESCQFGYPVPSSQTLEHVALTRYIPSLLRPEGVAAIAYLEPLPDYTWSLNLHDTTTLRPSYGSDTLTMPGYDDEMPLFDRAGAWLEPRRCYELPTGARMLTQAEAYDLWVEMIRKTLWFDVDQANGKRSLVGLRGAYPGTFAWHGNQPNWFNDTIVLLWRDEMNRPHVREFPINTETGARDFGYHESSSLRPNRHYPYVNGWHRGRYNALRMGSPQYSVRDDSNKNAHWDDDRNGWLDGGAADHYRLGSGHNIHMGSVEGSLAEIRVNSWSAGCQVIPGTDNWTEFIRNAWTYVGDEADYYLMDSRDIAPSLWSECEAQVGSYDCPHEMRSFPFVHQGNTEANGGSTHDVYNCSDADESGPEVVYVLNIRETGTLSISVSTEDDDTVDPDIHLLTGNDSDACLARGHRHIDQRVTPGRYLVVVDTWVNADGAALSGAYRLNVGFNP